MKIEMTVTQVQQTKRQLESTIHQLCQTFEADTGCSIKDVRLLFNQSIGVRARRVIGADVVCEL